MTFSVIIMLNFPVKLLTHFYFFFFFVKKNAEGSNIKKKCESPGCYEEK